MKFKLTLADQSYTIDIIGSFIVNVLDLLANFVRLERLLIVCINSSTNPIARWSFAGAVMLILYVCENFELYILSKIGLDLKKIVLFHEFEHYIPKI